MWVECSMFKFHTEIKDWIIFKLEYLSQQFHIIFLFPPQIPDLNIENMETLKQNTFE